VVPSNTLIERYGQNNTDAMIQAVGRQNVPQDEPRLDLLDPGLQCIVVGHVQILKSLPRPVLATAVWFRSRAARLKAAAQPTIDDPIAREARHELYGLMGRFRAAAAGIEMAQRLLKFRINEPVHRLLNDIPPNWDRNVGRELVSPIDRQSPLPAIRKAIDEATPLVRDVEDLRSRLESALAASKQNEIDPLPRLIWTLFGRLEAAERAHVQTVTELNERLGQIEAQISRISQLARYVRARRKEKPK
jgi:hypothetical protein